MLCVKLRRAILLAENGAGNGKRTKCRFATFFENPRFSMLSDTGNRPRFPDPLRCPIPIFIRAETKTSILRWTFLFWQSGLVHDIRAYWKTTGGWFSIPKLSHDHASIV